MAGYFFGIQPLFAIGKPLNEIADDVLLKRALLEESAHYDKQKTINGQQLRCSYLPIKIEGNIVAAVEVMIECREEMSIANELAELRQKNDYLKVLLDDTFEELCTVDQDGKITYILNKSARNLGYSPEELLGRDMSRVNAKCQLKKVAKTGIPIFSSISRPNKKEVPVLVSPIYRDSMLTGALCRSIFTDMSEAKSFSTSIQQKKQAGQKKPIPKQTSGCKFTFDDIIGNSKIITYVKKMSRRVAEGDSTILVTGESGTGKELFSQAIHMASLRANGPFVCVNCAGIPENLLESELFGYEAGAFTGAKKGGKPGKFELAHNGTIFLDEIGDMPMGMQGKILRVIQENEVEHVGGTVSYEVDVRIIAATNRDLWEMVNRGQFREDLYYRLDVVNIHIPPLRERVEDIPILIEHLIPRINQRVNSSIRGANREVLDYFQRYDWPGNIRELINVLESAMNLNTGKLVEIQSIPSKIKKKMGDASRREHAFGVEETSALPGRKYLDKEMIEQALIIKNGNKRQAAVYLNICRSTLYNKLKKYNIDATSIRES
jgi:transcriptional regulator with PAS, ATPase and Fis domain